jgi:hypothetical protein
MKRFLGVAQLESQRYVEGRQPTPSLYLIGNAETACPESYRRVRRACSSRSRDFPDHLCLSSSLLYAVMGEGPFVRM